MCVCVCVTHFHFPGPLTNTFYAEANVIYQLIFKHTHTQSKCCIALSKHKREKSLYTDRYIPYRKEWWLSYATGSCLFQNIIQELTEWFLSGIKITKMLCYDLHSYQMTVKTNNYGPAHNYYYSIRISLLFTYLYIYYHSSVALNVARIVARTPAPHELIHSRSETQLKLPIEMNGSGENWPKCQKGQKWSRFSPH